MPTTVDYLTSSASLCMPTALITAVHIARRWKMGNFAASLGVPVCLDADGQNDLGLLQSSPRLGGLPIEPRGGTTGQGGSQQCITVRKALTDYFREGQKRRREHRLNLAFGPDSCFTKRPMGSLAHRPAVGSSWLKVCTRNPSPL